MSLVNTSRMRFPGPLSQFKGGFAAELHRQGYRRYAAGNQLQLASHLSRWLEAEALDPNNLTPIVARRFLAARHAAGYSNHRTERALAPLHTYLRGLGAVPPPPPDHPATGPVDQPLERFCVYATR